MRNTLFISLFLLFLVSNRTLAQKNLQPGFIILNSNDTINGFINYKEWHRNPATIFFTTSKDVKATPYSTTDITYFEVNGMESYQRYLVKSSQDTQLFSDLADKDTLTKSVVVFLKVIYMGTNISLFSYKDELKLRWYIKEKNENTPLELLNSVYRVNGKILNEREYRSQLLRISTIYSPENQEIKDALTKANYTKEDILKICYKVNADENKLKIRKKNTGSAVFFAGLGINQGFIRFSGDNHFTDAPQSASYLPVLSGGVDIYPIPSVGKFFFRNKITFSGFKSKATSTTVEYFRATETYYFEFEQRNISVHSQLSYNFYNKPDFKWFIGVGAGFNISSYPKNQQTFVREGLSASTSVDDDYLEAIRSFWINASISSGVSVRNLDVSVCFFPASSIASYALYAVTNSSMQFQLNYLFKRSRTSLE